VNHSGYASNLKVLVGNFSFSILVLLSLPCLFAANFESIKKAPKIYWPIPPSTNILYIRCSGNHADSGLRFENGGWRRCFLLYITGL
jgi:hypothetical protein